MPNIRKKYFKIREVCEETGLESHVLRFWETEFAQLKPRKNNSGHRTYTREDIDLILKIKKLLHEEGFTISGAKKQLEGPADAQADQMEQQLFKNRVLQEIQEVKGVLENVLNLLDRE